MAAVLTNVGEEWVLEAALQGASVTIGLYNDTTDAIGDTDDLAQLTTEPGDGNYARQAATLTLQDSTSGDGDWEAVTSGQVSFDVTGTTGTVDSYFIVVNFASDDAGDSVAQDHLVVTGALSQSRDLSQIDTLNLAAGSVGFSLT